MKRKHRGRNDSTYSNHLSTAYRHTSRETESLTKDSKIWSQSRSSTTQNVSGHMKQHKSVISRIGKLSITQDTPAEDLTTLQFNPGSGSRSLTSSWFGEVVTSTYRERKLTFVTEFGRFRLANGVAVTQTSLLAVLDFGCDVVSVYRNVNGEYKNQFCLRPSYEPVL